MNVNRAHVAVLAAFLMPATMPTPASAQLMGEWKWLISTDLGSDLDFSDPMRRINSNGEQETMDCGDIYTEDGLLWKNDTADSANVPGAGEWMGRPFLGSNNAPQPPYTLIGEVPPPDPRPYYDDYFDLDAEDQLRIPVGEQWQTWPEQIVFGGGMGTALSRDPMSPNYHLWNTSDHFSGAGAFYKDQHNNKVHLSYDDDGAPGWAFKQTSGNVWWWDVPTNIAADHATEVYHLPMHLDEAVPVFDPMDPNTMEFPTAVLDEGDLNLGTEPLPIQYDDDVDALDYHPLYSRSHNLASSWYAHRYFSPDHEANLGLDPGDIYLTRDADINNDNNWVNMTLALDDVANFGVPDSTDIDAFEFITLDSEDTMNLFGYAIDGNDPVTGEVVSMYMLAALFSVDEDDPDCAGDESGGLNPGVVYASDLEGHYAAVSQVFDGGVEDIDAIALTPEPGTLSLLALGGLALIHRPKKV